MDIFAPRGNQPSSNYMFKNKLFQNMNTHYTKYELCIKYNTNLNRGNLNSVEMEAVCT